MVLSPGPGLRLWPWCREPACARGPWRRPGATDPHTQLCAESAVSRTAPGARGLSSAGRGGREKRRGLLFTRWHTETAWCAGPTKPGAQVAPFGFRRRWFLLTIFLEVGSRRQL